MNVSLIIPSYNSAHYLQDCLTSALSQNHRSFSEIIVVDDASQDSPQDVVARMGTNIKFFRHEVNQRVGAARNTGAQHATGDYLVFLDADDILDKDYLVKMEDFVLKNQLVCAGSWLYYMTNPNNKGKIIKTLPLIGQQARLPGTFPSGFLIKKTIFDQQGGFSSLIVNSEDTEFLWRLYKSGVLIYNLSEPLVGYRVNPMSKTSVAKERKMFFQDLLYLVYQEGLQIPLQSFHDIYLAKTENRPCPEMWEDNKKFQAIYRKQYPWRELTQLRIVYALWLERKVAKCTIAALTTFLRHPSFVLNRVLEESRR